MSWELLGNLLGLTRAAGGQSGEPLGSVLEASWDTFKDFEEHQNAMEENCAEYYKP